MDSIIEKDTKEKISGNMKRTFEMIGDDANSIPFQVSNGNAPQANVQEQIPKRRKLEEDGALGIKRGRWDKYEHSLFVKGLQIYGRQWKLIAEMIKTRTAVQIRSHAQKYFNKLEKLQHQRLIGMVAKNSGAQRLAFLPQSESANPYLQNNFNALAQVQMMMQNGQMPHYYAAQSMGIPHLDAFKALYARNQGGIAAPAVTSDIKTSPQTDNIEVASKASTSTTTTNTPISPSSCGHSATVTAPSTNPHMYPYPFHVPYVTMNHPLMLAAIQRQQIQQQQIQQQQHLLNFQKQTSSVMSPVVPTPTPVSDQNKSVHDDLKIDKDENVEDSKNGAENLLLKNRLNSRASPTVDVNGTSSPTRAKRVEITKPASDTEENEKSEDQSLSVLASLASSDNTE